jgi:signal transduction histidine kinase
MILMAHRSATGEVEIFSTISRDISERKHAEEVKQELAREQTARAIAEEAVRIRDDFVAIAGHELKTPLTALLMQVQSIRRAVAGDGVRSEERVERIARSAQRLEKLINQLLDVSRIGAGRLELETEAVDLGALVREVVHRFADASAQAGSPITVDGTPSIEGHWDRLRIDQVLTNLVANAIKYGEGRPIEVEMSTDGTTAVVRVADHGIGIDSEHQGRIFERFERAVAPRAYAGLGLGLWISRQIVEAAGGTIGVESQPGHGSTFTIRLPLHAAAQPHAA